MPNMSFVMTWVCPFWITGVGFGFLGIHTVYGHSGGVQAQVGERSKDWGGVGGLAVYGTRVYEPLLSTLWQYTRYAGTLHIACSGMTRSVLDHDIARGWGRRTGPHHSTLIWAS